MRLYTILFLFLLAACTTATETESSNAEPPTEVEAPAEDTLTEEAATTPAPEVEEVVEESTTSEYDDMDWQAYEESMTQDFSFVILISTTSYDAALKRAKDASEKLGYPLDLRELHPNEETGLSLPKEVCEDICGGGVVDYPHYLPRNDWGESKYVSVEYSDGFDGFNPGYYIVVVASGEKGDPIIEEALKESQQFYEDAYAKTCGVWMGCGC